MKLCVSVAVYNADDYSLLCVERKQKDGWTLPGGKVEASDLRTTVGKWDSKALQRAAARELLEEPGLDLSHTNLFPVFATGEYGDRTKFTTMFESEHVFRQIGHLVGETAIRWMRLAELLRSTPFHDYYRLAASMGAFSPRAS